MNLMILTVMFDGLPLSDIIKGLAQMIIPVFNDMDIGSNLMLAVSLNEPLLLIQ